MSSIEARSLAYDLVEEGRGVLAADESPNTMGKRLERHNKLNTEDVRRDYREVIFTAPKTEKYISAVIMHEETLFQRTTAGDRFVEVLADRGIHTIIKTDEGLRPLSDGSRENMTGGIDTLVDRLKFYRSMGAVATKWRTLTVIDEENDMPSKEHIMFVAENQAEQAYIAQQEGFVPIVEPEVFIEGNHNITLAHDVMEVILKRTSDQLEKKGVDPGKMLLKTSFVTPGKQNHAFESVNGEDVGRNTNTVLSYAVHPDVPGVVMLSGGLSPEKSTEYLNALNQAREKKSFQGAYSFSYGRALQEDALRLWAEGDILAAQDSLRHRSGMNSLASLGLWTPDAEYDL